MINMFTDTYISFYYLSIYISIYLSIYLYVYTYGVSAYAIFIYLYLQQSSVPAAHQRNSDQMKISEDHLYTYIQIIVAIL